jgi:hypothetical protein
LGVRGSSSGFIILTVIARILERGHASGAFRRNADALDVALFGHDLVDMSTREHYRTMIGDMVVSYLIAPDSGDRGARP